MLIFPRKRHFQPLLAQLIRRQNSVLSERLFIVTRFVTAAHTNKSSFHFHQKKSLALLCSLVTLDVNCG